MSSAFAATAAATAACLSGVATVAFCEKNLQDPMTVYAVNAAKNEQLWKLAEKLDKEEAASVASAVNQGNQPIATQQNQEPGTYIAATSPTVQNPPSDMTVEEQRLEAAATKAKRHAGGLKLFSGNGNMGLSIEVAKVLGINLGKATVGRFADGEVNVMIHENVRGKDVYIIQPTCPPVNDNIMELLLMVSTLNRASARRITVVIPYYGYARQDRKMQVS